MKQNLDQLLRQVPDAPLPLRSSASSASGERDEKLDAANWDAFAKEISKKALASGSPSSADKAALDALTAPPALDPEPGEPSEILVAPRKSVQEGTVKMSADDQDPPPSVAPTSVSRPSTRTGRPSLKELAERVSKTPPPPSVSPLLQADATPFPAAPSSQRPSSQGPASQARPSVPSAPPVSTATPLPVSRKSGLPGSIPTPKIIEANAPAAANDSQPELAAAAPVVAAPVATAQEEKKGGPWMAIGGLAAVVAIAAGAFFYIKSTKNQPAPQDTGSPTVAEAKAPDAKTPETAAPGAPAPAVTAPKEKDPNELDLNAISDVSAQPTSVSGGGPLPSTSSSAAAVASNDDPKIKKIEPEGTLQDAIKRVAGPGEADDGKPAVPAADDNSSPKNVPDNPPQGSVTAALGSVTGAARGCVSGADDVSTAMVTFRSDGTVQSVSVSGWAAGKPAQGCIQSAMKSANVGRFSKPTFSVPVRIRP